MTSPLFWVVMNILVSLAGAMMSVYMIRTYFEAFLPAERAALGGIGAACVLRIAPLFARNLLGENSPFDDWSALLLVSCVILMMACRIKRLDALMREG